MALVDLVFALALLALGIGTVVESWRMPRFENLGINPYSVPGLVPGLIGAVLVILASVLLLRSAGRLRRGVAGPTIEPLSARRFAATAVLTLGYAAILVGRVPFWLATFLFITTFILLFEWRHRQGLGPVLSAIVQGGLTAAGVSLLFRYVFLVRLP